MCIWSSWHLLDVDVLDRICRLNELLVKMLESSPANGKHINFENNEKCNRNSPNGLSHRPSRFVSLEYVTSETLYSWMFCNEPNISVIARMKSTERNILQRVEVVDTWFFLLFVLKINKKIEISNKISRNRDHPLVITCDADRSTIRNP